MDGGEEAVFGAGVHGGGGFVGDEQGHLGAVVTPVEGAGCGIPFTVNVLNGRERGLRVPGWRVFWVGEEWLAGLSRRDLETVGMRPGDPVFVAPDLRIDPILCRYGKSRRFRAYTVESKRNFSTDLTLLLTFLWSRGLSWLDAHKKDLDDFEDWRRRAPKNPERIGDAKWNRELAAFSGFFKWAKSEGYLTASPVATRRIVDERGAVLDVPVSLAPSGKSAKMHWLTPRTWRLWTDVGLRGHTQAGIPGLGWQGRLEDRNVAFVRLVLSSGLRRQEAGTLLTFELPGTSLPGNRYCRGTVAGAVTRSKATRTFYAATDAIGEVETYCESSRAWAVRKAQRAGRYDQLSGMRLVTKVTAGPRRVVHWVDWAGEAFQMPLERLTAADRIWMFTEGPDGPEPLWLWLNEAGLPFQIDSWEAVFRTANMRCQETLTPPRHLRPDPHRVYAPYATVHAARHSFALFALVVLNSVMDRRYGLSPAERRDFRLLYGDPWFMVQGLLGHATRQVTVDTYLAPVRHLQMESLLADVDAPSAGPLPDLDGVFSRIASTAETIQDIDTLLAPTGGTA